MALVGRLFSLLEREQFNIVGVKLLRILLGIVLVHRGISEFRYAGFLYSDQGASYGSSSDILGLLIGKFMDSLFYSHCPWLVSVLWLLGGLALILNKFTKIGIIACLLGYIMTESRTVIQDGGDNISRITLFYMLFLSFNNGVGKFRTALHNLGVASIYLQLVILYSISGISKLQGDYWVNGTALYYILNVQWFSTNIPLVTHAFKLSWVTALASYTAIAYMIGFPFMLLNRLHLLWAALGILFHLMIALTMGLVDFSVIMIGLILFTISNREYYTLKVYYGRLLSMINSLFSTKTTIMRAER
jgi:hypothetical protein